MREDLSNIMFPHSYMYSGRAEGRACDNPLALQFWGRKQEVGKSRDYHTFLSMENGSSGQNQKPNNSENSGKPAPTRVWAESSPQEAQWSTVHGAYLSCVKNAVERKLWGAKEAKQQENKRQGGLWQVQVFYWNFKDQHQTPVRFFFKWLLSKLVSWGL